MPADGVALPSADDVRVADAGNWDSRRENASDLLDQTGLGLRPLDVGRSDTTGRPR